MPVGYGGLKQAGGVIRKMAECYTDPNFWIACIGASAAVIAIFIAILKLNKSIKISLSNTETIFLREFNEQNEKCRTQLNFTNLIGILNVLDLVVRQVKRGIYPFELYKKTYFDVTFEYILTLEMTYYTTPNKTTNAFKNDFERYLGGLLPVFDLYEEKTKDFLEGKGLSRTTANLKLFLGTERKPSKSDFRKLKYKIKYPLLCSIGEALGFL